MFGKLGGSLVRFGWVAFARSGGWRFKGLARRILESGGSHRAGCVARIGTSQWVAFAGSGDSHSRVRRVAGWGRFTFGGSGLQTEGK